MMSKQVLCAALLVAMITMAVVMAGCARRAQLDAPQVTMDPPMPPDVAPAEGGEIRLIGSTTVLPLGEQWHKGFNEINPAVNIAVSGGGSGAGIEALIAGTADIAMSSRDIKDAEVERARTAGIEPVEHVVAYDGIVAIVHPSNPVTELSVEQLSDIYSGHIRDWKDVGGDSGEIQVVSRDSASGTYESFKEMVVTLDGKDKERDYAAHALKQASNQAILSTVGQTWTAIGYVGLGYLDDTVKAVNVIKMGATEPVEPTMENIMDGSYAIARALHFYTNGEPTGVLKEFTDYVKSPHGQVIVEEVGFVPIAQ